MAEKHVTTAPPPTGAPTAGPSRGAAWSRVAYVIAASLLAAGALIQVFLAGLGVFADARTFATHRDFGYLLGLVPIALLVLSVLGRMPRVFVLGSVLLGVQFALQSVLVLLRPSAPVIAALHPVNGFLIVLVALWLAASARRITFARAGR